MPDLHDLFAKNLLCDAIDPIAHTEMEKPVMVLYEQFVDVYCSPRACMPLPHQAAYLGWLYLMAQQRCMFEPSSESPSVDDLGNYERKQLSLQWVLQREENDDRLPRPLLWVLSPGRPEEAMAGYEMRPAAGWPPGFYTTVPALRMYVVVLSELPPTAETRLLRLLGNQRTRLQAMQEIKALPPDDPQRQPLLEMVMELRYLLQKQVDLQEEDREVMTQLRQEFEQFKADLRREGRVEGQVEGKIEARAEAKAEAVLALLRARGIAVHDSIRERILACRDLATLEQWLTRATTAATDSEVLAAA